MCLGFGSANKKRGYQEAGLRPHHQCHHHRAHRDPNEIRLNGSSALLRQLPPLAVLWHFTSHVPHLTPRHAVSEVRMNAACAPSTVARLTPLPPLRVTPAA